MSSKLKNPAVVRILDGAEVCFGRAGYHGTSLREIAEQAGVSKALIHYHFETKEALALALEARVYQEVADEVTQLAAMERPGIDTAEKALDVLARATIRYAPLLPVFVELGAEVVRHEDLRQRAASFYREATALILTGIRQTLGPLADHLTIPAERLASLMMSCLQGIALSTIERGSHNAALAFEDFKKIMLGGLFGASGLLDGLKNRRPATSSTTD